ncbi:hypothetical protein [Gallaecimonas sp. GXIMD4217]|uniref:hypothetical protein n=1 Tax=Gallaecimonas sp. GXIMD4217 TaxID=3131927 RepID=UPI00311B0A3F
MRWLTALLVLMLTACGDPLQDELDIQSKIATQQVNELGTALDQDKLRNARLLKDYAKRVKDLKPDYASLVDELAKDASRQGPLYQSLQERLETALNQPEQFAKPEERLRELINIREAADKILFNDALADPLNVLADLSGGALPRVNALPKAQSQQANQAEDFGAGSQLIGNPGYGQWVQRDGMSFWEWYGMYALFSNLFDRPIHYDRWSRHRDYSYYSDYGRYRYTKPRDYQRQQQRAQKAFKSDSRFKSPYAKSRTGASRLSQASRQAPKTVQQASKFRGGGSKFASKSKYNSSFRNSQNRTSRGVRRGK